MAGRQVRLFLSHSSHAEGSVERLNAVATALNDREITVLYDKREIKTGHEWRERICGMLAACDAAAFLLTDDALTSPWVLREADILRWRQSRSQDFRIMPVSYGTLDPDARAASALWNELKDLQSGEADTAAGVADIIAAELASLADTLAPTPLEMMARSIQHYLVERADPASLQQALLELGQDVEWDASGESDRLAFKVARWMLAQPPPALAHMVGAIKDLVTVDDRSKLLNFVLPLWVDPAAAAWFTLDRIRSADRHGVALACERPHETVVHFLQRAHIPSVEPEPLWINGVGDGPDAADIHDELKAVVEERLKSRSGRVPRPEDVEAACDFDWLVAAPLPSDAQVVSDLHTRYGNLTFIFYTPLTSNATAPSAAAVSWVEPPLEVGVERAVWQDYWAAVAT